MTTSDRSCLIPLHDLGDGMWVAVDRRVHGTNNEISGTAGYKYGLDSVAGVHCEVCCCNGSPIGSCGYPLGGIFRHQYVRSDPDRWFDEAIRRAAEHLLSRFHVEALRWDQHRKR